MLMMTLLAGAATGIVLGLFGSGGSIVTVPALLYLLHVEPKQAIAMSLGIVAVTAAISALDNWHRGNVDVRVAFVFGLFGILGTFIGTRLGVHMPASLQLGMFSAVMLIAAWRMLRRKKRQPLQSAADDSTPLDVEEARIKAHLGQIALLGMGVGVLTGLVGGGGGFLIVPALVLVSGIPMKTAIGTSLVIVAANASTGFAGYLGIVSMDWSTMATFSAVTVASSFIGTRMSHRLSHAVLRRSFAVFLIFVAVYMITKSVF